MKNLNVPIVSELMIPKLPVNLQEQYLQLVEQSDKSKFTIDSCIIIIRKALQSGYHYVWGICHDQF